jgi:hypothetical protein
MTAKNVNVMAYSKENKNEILTAIFTEINKGRAVRNVLKDEGMPDVTTFYRWIEDDEEKSKQYVRACENRADAIFDEIIDIADDSSGDRKVTEHGESLDSEFVARSRVRIDARKWIASKLNPKKYGDKTILSGDKDNPIETTQTIIGMRIVNEPSKD